MLKAEIDNDPLGRGYAAMTNQQVLDSLNVVDITVPIASVTSADVYDAIVPSEYTGLTATQKAILSDIFSLSEVRVQGNTRTALLDIFVGGTATRTALQALTTTDVSRATQLGLRRLGLGLIQEARR